MPRKRSKTKKHREPAIPGWQLEYQRTGEPIQWDDVFEQIDDESLWPTGNHPDPWEALHFEIYGAKDLWQRIRSDIDMSEFPFANKNYGMKNFPTVYPGCSNRG